jgi:hypothetical protein
VRALTDDLIDETVEHYLGHPQHGDDEILIERMHGAALRAPADATAFSRRDPCFSVSALAIWDDATQKTRSTSRGRDRRRPRWSHTRPTDVAISTMERRTSRSSACRRPMATPTSSGYAN